MNERFVSITPLAGHGRRASGSARPARPRVTASWRVRWGERPRLVWHVETAAAGT